MYCYNDILLYLTSNIVDINENDGGWSEWSSFGDCTYSGGDCKRTRHRNCDSPWPSERGLPCVGPDSESEDCDKELCTGRYFGYIESHKILFLYIYTRHVIKYIMKFH